MEVARLLGEAESTLVMIDSYNSTMHRSPGIAKRAVALVRRIADKAGDYPVSAIRARGLLFLRRLWAYSGYAPDPYHRRFLLIRSSDSVAATGDPHLGWADVARAGIALEIVDGDHESMMRDPDVRKTGALVQAFLDRSEDRSVAADLHATDLRSR
jgi:hypothetical protein